MDLINRKEYKNILHNLKTFSQTTKSNVRKFIYHPLGKVHCLVLHIAKQTLPKMHLVTKQRKMFICSLTLLWLLWIIFK